MNEEAGHERLEWVLRCMRRDDGSTYHVLWVYDDAGKSQQVTSFRSYPSGEEIAASLAMWRIDGC